MGKGVPTAKILLFFAVVLAMLAVLKGALADEPVLFDGPAVPGYEYTTSTGDVFKISYFSASDKVVVDLPGVSLSIENNSCNTGKRIRGCFTGSSFKGYNYSLPDRLVYQYKIKLYLTAPDIQVTSVIDNNMVEVGEATTVHVNITNQGSELGEVYLKIKIPNGLQLIEIPDQPCELSPENTLVMNVNLPVQVIRHCDFKVRPYSPGTYNVASTAEFDILQRTTRGATSTVTAKELPLFINSTLNQSLLNLLLGEKLNISFNLIAFGLNSTQKITSLNFYASMPDNLDITSISKIAKKERQGDTQKISYSRLTMDENVTIDIGSIEKKVGLFMITANATWLFGDFKQGINVEFPVNVTMAEPYIRLQKFDPQTGRASIDVINPAHLPIHNVVVDFKSFKAANGGIISAETINNQGHASFDIIKTSSDGNSSTIHYSTPYGQELVTTNQLPINQTDIGRSSTQATDNASNTIVPPAPEAQPPPPAQETPKPKNQNESSNFITRNIATKSPLATALLITGVIIALLVFTLHVIVTRQHRGTR